MKIKCIGVLLPIIVILAFIGCNDQKKFDGTYYGMLNNYPDTILIQDGPTQGRVWITEKDSGFEFDAKVHGSALQNITGQNLYGNGKLEGNNLALHIYAKQSLTSGAGIDTLVFTGTRR